MAKKRERIDIKSIKDPNIVKELNYSQISMLCADLRAEILSSVSRFGGHLSSNLGSVELTVALFRIFDPSKDKIIFDVGHQTYAEKLLTGRSLDNLGQKEAGAPFQDINESPYDVYEAGHSSTSLSAATAFAVSRDKHGENYDVVAIIGDSSMASGLAFEGLNNLAASGAKSIIVLNDNDMSISTPAGGLGRFFRKISSQRFYNKAKTTYHRLLMRTALGRSLYGVSTRFKNHVKMLLVPETMFDNLGYTYIGPVNGHNIKSLERAFKRAKNTTKSAVIHVYTKKGKGYPKAEEDKLGLYHGVGPFDLEEGASLNPMEGTWPALYAGFIEEAMKDDPSIELVCPAMRQGSSLCRIYDKFPKRCHDVGIAEEHAVTFSGALSLCGEHPVAVIYSTFLQRAYDQLVHDVARIGADVSLFIDRAGPVGKDGATHQGLYDVAFLSSIPGTRVAMASTARKAELLADMSLKEKHGIFAIRYSKEKVPERPTENDVSLEFGKMDFVKPDGKTALVAVGPRGLELYESLEPNKDIAYIDPVFLNDFDPDDVKRLLGYAKIFVYDSYSTEKGFAENLSSALLKAGYRGRFESLSFKNAFVSHASVIDQLFDAGLDIDSAKKAFLDFVSIG